LIHEVKRTVFGLFGRLRLAFPRCDVADE